MKIYNTLTRKKEELKPISDKEVKIYACGPTVYNYIHIGNARPMCVFDVLRNYLEYRGYKVNFMQNFTDIDDKIIKKAQEENATYRQIADRYIKEYKIDSKGLNIKAPTHEPKATDYIDHMIKIIKTLEDKGFAYQKGSDVFFRVKNYETYGNLSKMPMEELETGVRIEVNEKKESPLDFVLWKGAKEGEPSWESPWGEGRPGWHIECTAMINKVFGSTIDIHCGGQDLIFPHHENEIAQSECYTGEKYVNYWMHNGYINVDNKKMSKSAGNFFTVRDVAEKFGYEAIRFMMLQVHYRSPINYSYEVIKQSIAGLERIKNCGQNLKLAKENKVDADLKVAPEEKEALNRYREEFIKVMDDDLNTADAISVIFELVTCLNTNIVNKEKVSIEYLNLAQEIFEELTGVLGISAYEEVSRDEEVEKKINELLQRRQQARKEKNYKEADKIRDEISSMGYIIEDTPSGAVVKLKKEI